MGVKEEGASGKLSKQSEGLAWRTKDTFLQQAFLECLLCAKHRGYCSDLERPGLYLLRGGVEGSTLH